MYTREILPPISSPIEDGNPVMGTWNKAFDKVDLLEIKKPFRYPFPRWVRNFRIKEWQSFNVNNESYTLDAIFCNVKLFRMAQVILYDKKNNQRFFFRKIKPGTGWQLPLSLANSSIDSHSPDFYFRIHNWLDADTVKLDINIEAKRKQPSLTVHLAFNINRAKDDPMAVSLGFSKRRIMYAYKAFAPVQGDIVYAGKHISINQDTSFGFFCDFKGFFPYRMRSTFCSAAGYIEENSVKERRFGFHIAENQTSEKNKNNENALWIDGKLTPLPPVLITMPNGTDDTWVIQDVEGMIDLTFTQKDYNKNGIKLFITRADYNIVFGYYNGMLVNSDGEKIQIKNLFGMGKKLYLRV
ncbi:MAG: DUF2804 domain-containing protein [Treponema sp.]|nr:DUF2804 domain-containing protein [Treponema sp.]